MTATLNLDALDAFAGLDIAGQGGTPLQLTIETVHEDPDQPRRAFDPGKLAELTESIKASGVRSPVSVRPHPDIAGHYILNFGARRYRASLAAGRTTIPAFVDQTHTDFEQVVENLQRDDLTAMEMALFIHRKVKEGVRKGEIARRLGISSGAVSKHLILVEGPEEIEALYSSGKCKSPETLYEVSGLISKWPDETRAWLADDADVTRASVEALKRHLAAKVEGEGAPPSTPASKENVEFPQATPSSARMDMTPAKFRRPILYVSVDGRQGVALLSERPATDRGLIVMWEDGERAEVPADAIRIERLAEG